MCRLDVQVRDEGTVVLFVLRSRDARRWLADNWPTEDWQWVGDNLGVSVHDAGMLAGEMLRAGLTVL